MRRAALLPALLLAGCALPPPHPPGCPAGMTRATFAEAVFGRNAEGREVVSDAAWRDFLETRVTPAFPDGLTVMEAAGQWRGRDGRIERERSLVLLLALPGASAEAARDRLAPVIAAYRDRFAQEGVMLLLSAGCVGF